VSFFSPQPPRIFGHRGAAGLAPENTLPSFALAAALGVKYLELDVHATEDGVIVVIHDPNVDRTTNGSGRVNEITFAQLRSLDAGHHFTTDGRHFPYRGQGIRVPTLEEVLQAFPALCFNIEVKQGEPPIVDQVVRLLDRHGAAERTVLAAEFHSIMQEIRRAAGDRIATSSSAEEVVQFLDRFNRNDWAGYEHAGRALQIPPQFGDIVLVSKETVEAAHRLGIEVHVWTINDAEEMLRLLDLGVDGIMSDLPGIAVTAVGSHGS